MYDALSLAKQSGGLALLVVIAMDGCRSSLVIVCNKKILRKKRQECGESNLLRKHIICQHCFERLPIDIFLHLFLCLSFSHVSLILSYILSFFSLSLFLSAVYMCSFLMHAA